MILSGKKCYIIVDGLAHISFFEKFKVILQFKYLTYLWAFMTLHLRLRLRPRRRPYGVVLGQR